MWSPGTYAQAAVDNAAKGDTEKGSMYSRLALAAAIDRLADAGNAATPWPQRIGE
jgi:hypothetical protein